MLTSDTNIIIYGAGYCGAMFVEMLNKSGIQPLYVFDKDTNKQKQLVFGVQVVEPHFVEADVVVIAILSKGRVFDSIRQYLLDMGYREEQIIHIYDLPYQHDIFKHQKLVLKPDISLVKNIRNQWDELENMLSDEESKQVLRSARQFLCGEASAVFPSHMIQEQYFAYDIYRKISDECFVDCGGFKGEVMKIFLDNQEGIFSRYTLIEPDEAYNVYIEENMTGYDKSKIDVLNYALADRDKRAYVTNYMNMNSVVSYENSEYISGSVQVRTLDGLLENQPCTFLKIDVEGYELELLEGAKNIICQNRPVIAIASYHHEDDLIKIGRKLIEYYAQYRLYLRSYMNYQEMILYAVPEKRCR